MVSFETVHKHLLNLLHKWSCLRQFINIRNVELTIYMVLFKTVH